jgi:hypothetical protein
VTNVSTAEPATSCSPGGEDDRAGQTRSRTRTVGRCSRSGAPQLERKAGSGRVVAELGQP